jgi:hypothetical protein
MSQSILALVSMAANSLNSAVMRSLSRWRLSLAFAATWDQSISWIMPFQTFRSEGTFFFIHAMLLFSIYLSSFAAL